MDFLTLSSLLILGLAVGLIISLLGVSGSVFVVPILLLFYSTSIYSAIGTSLFVDMVGATIVAISFFRKEKVDLRATLLLIITALVGSQIGVLVAVNTGEASLSNLVCLIFIGIGIIILFRSFKQRKTPEKTGSQKVIFQSERQKEIVISSIGLFIGLMSGIFGAGGGMMIIFVLLVIFQYPPHTAVGTATAIMAIIALSGVIGYSIQGYINFEYGLIISIGAVISGSVGSVFSNRLNETTLTFAMGLIFILVGISTLFLLTFL
ncbi:MAG: sulfite exporter TauE/SafE family protein [Candidatus Heimdallarchaeota archaeon]|nr:MAG: sulfite exporter TauE/SafE family protein [Candidatus Heimdallarchaeota archaeon]